MCVVCKGFEGSLPTDCPGVVMSSGSVDAQADRVYGGMLDYRESRGGWCTPDGSGSSMGDMDIRFPRKTGATID